jgi:hypothetical protein
LDQYSKLRAAIGDLRAGDIDWSEYVARHLNNPIFTQINMGSENYALACFEDLYFREPTNYEVEASVAMLDGQGAFLFLEYGDSRDDFNWRPMPPSWDVVRTPKNWVRPPRFWGPTTICWPCSARL